MPTIGEQFRQWVLSQDVMGSTPVALDRDHMRVALDTVTAEVNIYPSLDDASEIAEYRITRILDGETTFFLHVLLDDLARAQELFGEMVDALRSEADHQATHVLLTCTSALTTSMFAAKMGSVAEGLSLDYDFTALPIQSALQPGGDWAAILLAPQVSHRRKEVMEAHPEAAVFEIPGKVFGSYDAGEAVRLVMHALREVHTSEDAAELSAVRALDDDKQVLIITLFVLREGARLGYRLYDKGKVESMGAVLKQRLEFRDIEDLIEALLARSLDVGELDAIGLAVPGVTQRGTVTLPDIVDGPFDLGRHLAKRFGLPVYLDNNCNAAAVGCYVAQEKYESLVFFRHAFGHEAGGMGTVIDGKLLKGWGNLAGEPKYFEHQLAVLADNADAAWSAEGLAAIARGVSLAAISVVAPQALYLAVDTIDDADEFRASLAEVLGEEYAPPVHVVRDYVERVYLGELAMCLQKLRDPQYRSLGVGAWKDIASYEG